MGGETRIIMVRIASVPHVAHFIPTLGSTQRHRSFVGSGFGIKVSQICTLAHASLPFTVDADFGSVDKPSTSVP